MIRTDDKPRVVEERLRPARPGEYNASIPPAGTADAGGTAGSPTLRVIPPCDAAFQDRRVQVGFRAWLALGCLLAADGNRTTVGAVARAVWGDERRASRPTVKATLHRLNKALRKLGHPLAAAIDGDEVLLV